jgi:Domain of unknown function (DUF4115)
MCESLMLCKRGTLQREAKNWFCRAIRAARRRHAVQLCPDSTIFLDRAAATLVNYSIIVTDSIQPQPLSQTFDEQSALAELEQLADKIRLSRRQREQKVAEFDAFVRTFRQDQRAQSIAATERELRRAEDRPSVVSAATHAAQAAVPATDAMALEVADSIPATAPWSASTAREPIAPVSVAGSTRPRAAYVGVVLAALALLAVGVLLWRSAIAPVGPTAQPDARSAPATSPAPAGPAAQAAAPTPLPAPNAGPPRPLNVEFLTLRPVWARVTVDGRRAVEKEFAAGERMSFGADTTIAIRAGNAGAIRLVVDGQDLGVPGRDGQVFSRTFTVRAGAR